MPPMRIKLREAGLASLAIFLMLFSVANAAYPPEADLSVVKSAPLEVNPGEAFSYVITVSNGAATAAPEVVVTDKLPYEVELVNITVDPSLGESAVNMSGDLIYVRFDEIPANTTGNIVINVNAPPEGPTTLYNIVNLRYGNDPDNSDNSMTISTYVLQVGYDQTEAAKSFEDLLHNQSQMLFEFEDLLHTIPSNASENYIFIASFEQLLRSQANLTSSFEDLLTNASSTGWDTAYSEENRTYLLKSYEQMLWDEAFLFASFHTKLNDSWFSLCNYTAPGHTQDAQTEFTASFEDLLHRQNRLYKSFDLLMTKLDITDHQALVNFLAAYENRMRVQANLYMSFYQLLSWKYEGQGPCDENITPPTPPVPVPPTISVVRTSMNPGQKFNVTVTNNNASAPLLMTALSGTFNYVPNVASVPTYALIGPALAAWTMPANVATLNAVPTNIGPSSSQVFTLDNMQISNALAPGNLTYSFVATTSQGTVTATYTDAIPAGLLSPAPGI